jgi:hypothetical protein
LTVTRPGGVTFARPIFDGVARHSQEGNDFVDRSMQVGFREAVRERDRPFQDYGERSASPPTA